MTDEVHNYSYIHYNTDKYCHFIQYYKSYFNYNSNKLYYINKYYNDFQDSDQKLTIS